MGAVQYAGSTSYQHALKGVVVYLAPTLELDSQRVVDYTIAHELAHVFLGHHRLDNTALQLQLSVPQYEDRPVEIAADALALKWGFQKPEGAVRYALYRSGASIEKVTPE